MESNYNGPGQNNNHYGGSPSPCTAGSSLANAAMIMGILAIVTAMFLPIYLPSIFGSLAILFALLSRGNARKLEGKAITGITCGTIGIGLYVIIFTSYSILLFSQPDIMTDTAKMYDDIIEQMYGVPSEDIFGESMEDMMKDLFPSH